MADRDVLASIRHNMVVRASAETYISLRSKGYEITTNPGSTKNRFIGDPEDPLYPDVIVWKPTYIGSTTGQAYLIEEIETESSINATEAERQWKKFGLLGVKFLMIVPRGMEDLTLQMITEVGARVDEIWTYSFDPILKKYNFMKTGLI